jgi:hypothetical protein
MRCPALFVAIVAVSVSSCNRWSDARISETKRRGDIISHALEAYHAKKGQYPFGLNELRPEFLSEIPQPTAGEKAWDYNRIPETDDYWLAVVASEFGTNLIRSKREWTLLDHRKT